MSNDYTEDRLIEQTCIDIFKNQLGWDTINAYLGETFGMDGLLGRGSESEIILKRDFFTAIQAINPALPAQAYENAYEIISEGLSIKSMAEINHEKYQYLKDGIPVTFKNAKGEIIRNKKIKVGERYSFTKIDEQEHYGVIC